MRILCKLWRQRPGKSALSRFSVLSRYVRSIFGWEINVLYFWGICRCPGYGFLRYLGLLIWVFSKSFPHTLGIWPRKWGEILSPQGPTAEDPSFCLLLVSFPAHLGNLCVLGGSLAGTPVASQSFCQAQGLSFSKSVYLCLCVQQIFECVSWPALW